MVRLPGTAGILALAGCGQIYPSTVPANGPANGIKSNIHDVVVGFAQQQLQAPYFAAMQVQSEEIAKESMNESALELSRRLTD